MKTETETCRPIAETCRPIAETTLPTAEQTMTVYSLSRPDADLARRAVPPGVAGQGLRLALTRLERGEGTAVDLSLVIGWFGQAVVEAVKLFDLVRSAGPYLPIGEQLARELDDFYGSPKTTLDPKGRPIK